MKRITSNNNTEIAYAIVAMIFHLSVLKGYTTEGGYFFEADKSYYNNVRLSNAHLADAIRRVAGIMEVPEDFIRENIRIENEADHLARAAAYNAAYLNWYAGVDC